MENIVSVRCVHCDAPHDVPATAEQLAKWKGGMLIQHAMPNLSDELRELLISGICPACWKEIFGKEEF